MSSAVSIVELVAIEQLGAGVSLADVYQDAPDNTAPPVVIVGDISFAPLTDAPDEADGRVSLSVVTVTAGDERKPCLDIQDEVETTLRGRRIEQDGWLLSFRCLGSDAALAAEADGYVGTTSFEVLALKQD